MRSIARKAKVRLLRIISRMNEGGPAIQTTGLMNNLPKSEFEQILLYGYCSQDEVDHLDKHSTIQIPVLINNLNAKDILQQVKEFAR